MKEFDEKYQGFNRKEKATKIQNMVRGWQARKPLRRVDEEGGNI